MKKCCILICLCITLISCNSEFNKDAYFYMFFDKSELNIESYKGSYMQYATIESGENLVFEYRFIAQDEEKIADDEYSETIRFEIDTNINKFSYSDDELLDIKAVFTQYCYCGFPPSESKNVNPKGTISGEKISNKEWRVRINTTFYGNEKKDIEGVFKLK